MGTITLFLNDIAGTEILLILAFMLMFFGAKSIPDIARTLGRTFRQIKDASDELKNEIKKSGMDIKKDLNVTKIIDDTANDIRRPLDQYANDIHEAVNYQPKKVVKKPVTPVNPTKKDDSKEEKNDQSNEDKTQATD